MGSIFCPETSVRYENYMLRHIEELRRFLLTRNFDSSRLELWFSKINLQFSRSQWPPGLRRRSAVVRLLILWVRIPPAAWMSVCCERSVLSGRGPCDELITRPEESYRLWCVVVCDLETSWMRSRTQSVVIELNTLRTGLLNCLNARSRGLTFRHRASCI